MYIIHAVVFRSVTASGIVALDYKISLHDVTRDSPDYESRRKEAHKRAAQRLLQVCLRNGGLYIKLGQGLVTMNHMLPKEYLETLVVLQDKVLTRGPHEVSVTAGSLCKTNTDTGFLWSHPTLRQII